MFNKEKLLAEAKEEQTERDFNVTYYLVLFIVAVVLGITVDLALGILFGVFAFFVYALTEG